MENLNNKQQAQWVLLETGRQLVAPFKATFNYLAHDLPLEIRWRREFRKALAGLTDDHLIDRIMIDDEETDEPPFIIAVDPAQEGMDHSVTLQRSIDGILRTA